MPDKDESRFVNLQKVIRAYRDKEVIGDFKPSVYVLDPTNICNFDCIMCPTQQISAQHKGLMDFELFSKIVDQIEDNAMALMLYNMGESLLHPRIVDMVQYLSDKNIKTILSTNGSRLLEPLSTQLLDAGIDEMILCLDGDSAETYEKIRKRGKFDEVLKNTISFLEKAKSYHNTTCYVQMIAMNLNQHERKSFMERWSQYDCIPIVTWFDTWAGQLSDGRNMSTELCPNTKIYRQSCADLWFKMTINWNGEVILCPHDWSYQEKIGDLNFQTISDVWHSTKIIEIRKSHIAKKYGGICASCLEWSREDEELEFFDLTNEQNSLIGYETSRPHFLKADEIKVED
jgi:spiro-SPASM protein